MAIEWGSYDNHLRVGIDYTVSPSSPTHSDTTVKVTWIFYADSDGWNFDDNNETYHYWGDGFDDTWSFDNHITGSSVKVGSHSETYSISSSSGSKIAHAHLYGVYNGASPTKDRSINLPNRPAAPPPTITTPSAGEAPTAGSITSSGATISWGLVDDNGGDTVDEYQLQVDNSSGFGSPAVDWTGTGLSHAVSGLASNTKYYARVRAHNSAGWGDWTLSTYCPFTTDGDIPSTVGAPKLTSKTSTSVTVSWSAADSNGGGSITYNLQWATNSAFTGATTINTSSTSATVNGLTASETIYLRVRATNSVGSAAYSASLTAETTTANPGGWDDEGDYVTLVNNLASAVADQIAHLGMYTYRVHTGQVTMPNATTVYVSMGHTPTGTFTQGPSGDTPDFTGSGASDMTVRYPGTYHIEFGFHWPYSGAPSAWHGTQTILVNGNADLLQEDQKGGLTEMILFTGSDGSSPGQYVMRHTVHLVAGDTIGFSVWQDTGSSMTTGTTAPVIAYSRITMIGF